MLDPQKPSLEGSQSVASDRVRDHTATDKPRSAGEKSSVPEKVEASVRGDDRPMEKRHPTAPGALVWFTFPAVLIVVVLIGLIVMGFFQSS